MFINLRSDTVSGTVRDASGAQQPPPRPAISRTPQSFSLSSSLHHTSSHISSTHAASSSQHVSQLGPGFRSLSSHFSLLSPVSAPLHSVTPHASSLPPVSSSHCSAHCTPIRNNIISRLSRHSPPPRNTSRNASPPRRTSTSASSSPSLYHSRFMTTLEAQPSPYHPPATISRHAPQLANVSHLRPPVLAAHRLAAWSSPYAQRQRQALEAQLPPSLVDNTYRAIHDAIAPSTRFAYVIHVTFHLTIYPLRSTYAAGLLRFTQFCDSYGIDEEHRMPASGPLLASFAAHCRGAYEGKTIGSWLSGLRYWHIANRAHWHGDDAWVTQARTIARKEGTHHRRPLRAPVSFEHLHVLRKAIDISTPLGAAMWATATTTFFGCRRLGETTVKTRSSFDPLRNITRSTQIQFRSTVNGYTSVSVRIPWTKTTKQEGASIILTSRDDELCPIAALRNHLTINGNCPPDMSLFAYQELNSWHHMFRDSFLSFVNKIWRTTSLDHVSGHSFRIGGAVALLLAGVSPEIVAATGGWTSLAFLLYWRRMEEIIPMCTSQAYSHSHITRLSGIFEQFRIRQHITTDTIRTASS